jgi:hypothetical protein
MRMACGKTIPRRDPVETGGTYYRVLPEGTMEGWDGFTLRVRKPIHGLDLNRNFTANWRQEFEQFGAGPFPASEPEVRAVEIWSPDVITRHERAGTVRASVTLG